MSFPKCVKWSNPAVFTIISMFFWNWDFNLNLLKSKRFVLYLRMKPGLSANKEFIFVLCEYSSWVWKFASFLWLSCHIWRAEIKSNICSNTVASKHAKLHGEPPQCLCKRQIYGRYEKCLPHHINLLVANLAFTWHLGWLWIAKGFCNIFGWTNQFKSGRTK